MILSMVFFRKRDAHIIGLLDEFTPTKIHLSSRNSNYVDLSYLCIMSVAIVILNFNGRGFLEKFLPDVILNTPEGKIYVADFFFTTCPTICPKMKTQLLRIYDKFAEDDRVRILSHTIDPEYDGVRVLKEYAKKLNITSPRWNLVTGKKSDIYRLGEKSYMVTAQEDANEEGGFVHSGAFILVDQNRHVRGIYDGTKEEDVNHLIEDMTLLLKE